MSIIEREKSHLKTHLWLEGQMKKIRQMVEYYNIISKKKSPYYDTLCLQDRLWTFWSNPCWEHNRENWICGYRWLLLWVSLLVSKLKIFRIRTCTIPSIYCFSVEFDVMNLALNLWKFQESYIHWSPSSKGFSQCDPS